MRDPNTLRRLVETVTALPGFTADIGTRVLAVEPGYVEMALDRRPSLLQANGFFHGGIVAGLADHAAGGAVTTALPPDRFAVTINLQVSYLSPANGQSLVARARSMRIGGTIGVAQVEVVTVSDGREETCALATVTLRSVEMPTRVALRPEGRSCG